MICAKLRQARQERQAVSGVVSRGMWCMLHGAKLRGQYTQAYPLLIRRRAGRHFAFGCRTELF